MIEIIDSMRQGDAVYWSPKKDELGNLVYDRFSNPLYDEPVFLNHLDGTGVFWIQRSEVFVDKTGQERTSKALVFLGRDVEELGILFNGTIDDIPQGMVDQPLKIPRISQILGFRKIPTLDYQQYVRKAYL